MSDPSDELLNALLESPLKFSFFQAVRILQRASLLNLVRTQIAGDQRRNSPVGGDGEPDLEPVRFRVPAALSFPDTEISGLSRTSTDAGDTPQSLRQADMNVAFFGLTGPSGVLPYHYTTHLIQLSRNKDNATAEFFDLFNHRLISLFYKAWEKYRFPMVMERLHITDAQQEDDFSFALQSLAGFSTTGLRNRLQLPTHATAYYGGHLSRHPRSAVCLEVILHDYFGYPVKINQFIGQWLVTSEKDHSCLGGVRRCPRNVTLGLDVVLGEKVWDVSAKFRVEVGPLNYSDFQRLLPGGVDHLPMIHLIRACAGIEVDFDIHATLLAEQVPACLLSSDSKPTPNLGWNTWLLSGPHFRNVESVIFESGAQEEPESITENLQWAA